MLPRVDEGSRVSFDIQYCLAAPATGDPPDDEVRAWADQFPHFTRRPIDDGSVEYWYENEDTDVCFELTQEVGYLLAGGDDQERAPLPAPYRQIGWHGNLNYCRPSFFAYEAMPVLADFAARFGLTIFDPQELDDGRNGLMTAPHAPLLVSSWREHNQRAVDALFDHFETHEGGRRPSLPILDEAWLTSIWRHNFHREEIQSAYGEDAYVTRVSLVSGIGDVLRSAIVWGEGMSIILPRTDGILMADLEQSWFGTKCESKYYFISTEDALPFLENHRRDYDRDRSLHLLADTPGASLESTFKTMTASSAAADVTDHMEIISFGQCTDTVPQASPGTDPGMRVIVRDPDHRGHA